MSSLSLKKLQQRAKNRCIKNYKSLLIDRLLGILDKSEQVKKTRTIDHIRKENFDINKILRDIRTLYESEEDYYEPVRTSNAFNNNYIEYESNGDKDKILSIKEYLDIMKQYLGDMVTDYKTQGEWKVQLTIKTNFISSKDFKDFKGFNETLIENIKIIHKKILIKMVLIENIKIMIGNETDEIIEELFESLLQKYPKKLEKSMKGSEFVFDSVDLLCYKLHK